MWLYKRISARLNKVRVSTEIEGLTLQEQVDLLQRAAHITKQICAILDFDLLLETAVELIRYCFNYYHVHLYLLDENQEWAIFRAGTGEVGSLLLEHHYKVELNDSTLIGRCVQSRTVHIIGNEDVYKFRNPFLPDARAAFVLPLVHEDKVVGVLEVQEYWTNVEFLEFETIIILQTVADHLMVAMNNARQFEQLQQTTAST